MPKTTKNVPIHLPSNQSVGEGGKARVFNCLNTNLLPGPHQHTVTKRAGAAFIFIITFADIGLILMSFSAEEAGVNHLALKMLLHYLAKSECSNMCFFTADIQYECGEKSFIHSKYLSWKLIILRSRVFAG